MFKVFAYYNSYDNYGDRYEDYDTFAVDTRDEANWVIESNHGIYKRFEVEEVKKVA